MYNFGPVNSLTAVGGAARAMTAEKHLVSDVHSLGVRGKQGPADFQDLRTYHLIDISLVK